MAVRIRLPGDRRTTLKGEGYAFPGASLGLKGGDLGELVGQVRQGFPFQTLVRFQQESQLPLDRISQIVEIPRRTLARRRDTGRLTKAESERLLRLSLVFEKAVDLFGGDVPGALAWLERPSKALGGQSPLEAVQTEIGAREVEDLIGRLEHGVFT